MFHSFRILDAMGQCRNYGMSAKQRLVQINVPATTGDFSILLSSNHTPRKSDLMLFCLGPYLLMLARSLLRTSNCCCFGDSEGPIVQKDATSFGLNGNCPGSGGAFRMDRKNLLDFVTSRLLEYASRY